MSDKQRRLRDLARHTDRTPATCWGYGAFKALRPGSTTRWWVRSLSDHALARYRHAQGPWVPEEVDSFFQRLDEAARTEAFVIQQFVEPFVAGVTLCTADGLLTEGVTGAASVILREGGVGDLLASHGETTSWRLDRGAAADGAGLQRAHDSIPRNPGALWEWITDNMGEVFHVDRKELHVPLLKAVPRDGPPACWGLGRPAQGAPLELPDTSIAWLGMIGESGTVHISRGSPLAHLCYEAVAQGNAVVLEIPDIT